MDKEHVVCIHDGKAVSHTKNETILFASTWMDLEGIVPNEISQRKIHTV